MPTFPFTLTDGIAPVVEQPLVTRVTFESGAWTPGATWTILFSSTIGDFTTGYGDIAGVTPTFLLSEGNRVYIANGALLSMSALGDATGWEEQNIGAGNINFAQQYNLQDTLQAIAPFQGKLALIGTLNMQIWSKNADPALFVLEQVLAYIGTTSPLSVIPLGSLDIIMLDQTGARSIRARESTLNAFVDDLGVPIDKLVQASIDVAIANDTQGFGGVEVQNKRYLLFVGETIYVLSYFPSSKITAWSTWLAVNDSDEAFTPNKFVISGRRLYVRSTEGALLLYGGIENNTYDAWAVPTVELPWLDDGKPSINKVAASIDVACQGTWTVSVGMDPYAGNVETVATIGGAGLSRKDSTFDKGRIPYSGIGTHFKVKLVGAAVAEPAVISAIVFKYKPGNET